MLKFLSAVEAAFIQVHGQNTTALLIYFSCGKSGGELFQSTWPILTITSKKGFFVKCKKLILAKRGVKYYMIGTQKQFSDKSGVTHFREKYQ